MEYIYNPDYFSEDYNLLTELAKSGGLFNKIPLYLCLKTGIKWKKTHRRSVLFP